MSDTRTPLNLTAAISSWPEQFRREVAQSVAFLLLTARQAPQPEAQKPLDLAGMETAQTPDGFTYQRAN